MLGRRGPVVIGSKWPDRNPADCPTRVEGKQQGRSRRNIQALYNNEMKSTLDAEDFYAITNAHSENRSAQRREH